MYRAGHGSDGGGALIADPVDHLQIYALLLFCQCKIHTFLFLFYRSDVMCGKHALVLRLDK